MARKYIRHHNGTIHDVNADDFFRHLAQARQIKYDDKSIEPAREATPEEVAAYWRRMGFHYIPETDETLTEAQWAEREAAHEAVRKAAEPASSKPTSGKAAKE